MTIQIAVSVCFIIVLTLIFVFSSTDFKFRAKGGHVHMVTYQDAKALINVDQVITFIS